MTSNAATGLREIRVTNTLTRQKEVLETVEPGCVRMYGCGVTTYDYCHIGHALQAVFLDIIRRYLRYVGYKVIYVRNHTDVDDKIIDRARERGLRPDELAESMVQAADEDMASLGIEPADFEPRVSQTIPEIIAMIKTLVENGSAYATASGDVYYRVRNKKDYGKLSGRKLDEMRSGTRDLVQGDKEFALDFALWKHDETEGVSWDSPWSRGRPGWHIECSAMAKKYLGDRFDIHGGGRDLVFPHHENEIAQSESANQTEFARYWLHNGLVTINKQKMSKSLGNHLLIRDALKKWPAEVLRLSIISKHYSSNVDFSEQGFVDSFGRLYYYYETIEQLDAAAAGGDPDGTLVAGYDPAQVVESFHEAMSDDFNTARALAEFNEGMRKANELVQNKFPMVHKRNTAAAYRRVFAELGGVLGIGERPAQDALAELKEQMLPRLELTSEEILDRIAERKLAREQKDFALADRIREELEARGIELRDRPDGTDWAIRLNVWLDRGGEGGN